ncbi:MAG: efflux RND transporter periplasmic adaptor subunit [Phycisphaerales bacterium]|nr:efflux RND transporter periplasmic adaptor subunit [Phycisphaerales bacterium]
MSKLELRAFLAHVWRHSSAAVALLLIVGALLLGYRIGHPGSMERESHADTPSTSGGTQYYTCSMHPSVRLTDPKAKCPICFMDLIPVANHGGGEDAQRMTLSKADARASRIETAPVARFFPHAEVRLYGKVTYDETSVARLTAYFPGRIQRLFVNYVGVPVAKGDHIAEMYSPDLLASFEELRQAARASDASPNMSDIVREATLDTLAAAREKLRLYGLTTAQIADVEEGRHRTDTLTVFAPMGGVVTHMAVREGDYLNEGSPIATVANLTRLWLDLEAYESQLPLLRWGQQVVFTVEAHPGERFEGRISFIEPMVDEQTRTAAVRVAVDNHDGRLKPGMFASAVIRPRVGESGAVVSDELAGRLVCPMHPMIVKDGPGQCDICGMDLVTAESLGIVGDASQVQEPLVVPRTAVLFTGTRSVVYLEVPNADSPTYEGREVVLGPRAGDYYVVRQGLQEGERVVVHGAFRIDSAMQIAAKPSMMTPSADASHVAHAAAPDSFIFALKPVYAAYLDAQEALASDDLVGFTRAAGDLRTAIGFVPEAELVGQPLADWRRAAAMLRGEDEAPDIEAARARFESMSDAVIALQKQFGHQGSETWHIVYCPMAFDFKGADWMQRGEVVSNPYFGESMLRCGELRDALEPRPMERRHE